MSFSTDSCHLELVSVWPISSQYPLSTWFDTEQPIEWAKWGSQWIEIRTKKLNSTGKESAPHNRKGSRGHLISFLTSSKIEANLESELRERASSAFDSISSKALTFKFSPAWWDDKICLLTGIVPLCLVELARSASTGQCHPLWNYWSVRCRRTHLTHCIRAGQFFSLPLRPQHSQLVSLKLAVLVADWAENQC